MLILGLPVWNPKMRIAWCELLVLPCNTPHQRLLTRDCLKPHAVPMATTKAVIFGALVSFWWVHTYRFFFLNFKATGKILIRLNLMNIIFWILNQKAYNKRVDLFSFCLLNLVISFANEYKCYIWWMFLYVRIQYMWNLSQLYWTL